MAVHIFKTEQKAVYTFTSKAARDKFKTKYKRTQKAKERGISLDVYLAQNNDNLYSVDKALRLTNTSYHTFKKFRDNIEMVTITRNCKLIDLSELKRILNN